MKLTEKMMKHGEVGRPIVQNEERVLSATESSRPHLLEQGNDVEHLRASSGQ
jgi:hypothetical protein